MHPRHGTTVMLQASALAAALVLGGCGPEAPEAAAPAGETSADGDALDRADDELAPAGQDTQADETPEVVDGRTAESSGVAGEQKEVDAASPPPATPDATHDATSSPDDPSGDQDPTRLPAARVDADGEVRELRRGSYCWDDGSQSQPTCGDAPGIVTPRESLSVTLGTTFTLTGPAVDAGIKDAGATVHEIGRRPIREDEDSWTWESEGVAQSADMSNLSFQLNAPPGSYALDIRIAFEQGEVHYGIIIDVAA